MSSDSKARLTILETILEVQAEGEQLSMCDRLDVLSVETSVVRNERCWLQHWMPRAVQQKRPKTNLR